MIVGRGHFRTCIIAPTQLQLDELEDAQEKTIKRSKIVKRKKNKNHLKSSKSRKIS